MPVPEKLKPLETISSDGEMNKSLLLIDRIQMTRTAADARIGALVPWTSSVSA